MRSFVLPDRVILNERHPLVRSFRSGHINFWSGTLAWEVYEEKNKEWQFSKKK